MAGIAATYIGIREFSVIGNKVTEFNIGRRIQANCGVDGMKYGTIDDSTAIGGITIINLDDRLSDTLTLNLTEVSYGIVQAGVIGSVPEHNHDGNPGTGGSLISEENTYYVSVLGDDVNGTGSVHSPFKTINYALSTITDNTTFNRYSIRVSPGQYYEDPITTKSFVDLVAQGSVYTTTIIANDSTSDLITYLGDSIFSGFGLTGATAASAISYNKPGRAGVIRDIALFNVNIGLEILGGSLVVSGLSTVPVPFTSIGTFIKNTSTETVLISTPYITTGSNVDIGILTSGSGVTTQIITALIDGASITTGLQIENGATVEFFGLTAKNCTNGIKLDGGSHVDGVSPYMDDSVTNHVVVEDLISEIHIQSGKLNRERLVFPVGYDNETFSSFSDPTNRETISLGDSSFGRAEHGSRVSIGQGRPYTQGMNVLTTDDTATSVADGTNFIDVSVVAASDSTATFSFQGVEKNHTILIGSEKESATDLLKIEGFSIEQILRAIEDAERSFLLEYWDGSIWTEMKLMAVANEDNHTYANSIFIRSNSDEIFHIRPYDDQQKKTINGKNLYWVRFRITDTLIQAPTFSRLRLETSITRFNQSGIPIFISTARFRESLYVGHNYGRIGNVTSGSHAVGVGATPYGWSHNVRSSIMNDNDDALQIQFSIPIGVCTSCPINIKIDYRIPTSGVSTDGIMTISCLPVEAAGVYIADQAGGEAPIPRSVATTNSLTALPAQISTHSIDMQTNDKVLSIISNDFNIDSYYEGDYLFIQIQLDDHGSAAKPLVLYGVEIYGVKWRLGGRIDLGYIV